MTVTDTSQAAHAVQFAIYRSMSAEERLLTALEMSLFARELRRQGIRDRYPQWTEERIERELLRLTFLPADLPAWLK